MNAVMTHVGLVGAPASRVTRPALRYHGGKWQLAPWIVGFFPEHRIYTETFGGGASVLLHKPCSYLDVYNDLDDQIVNVFSVLRDTQKSVELKRTLKLTPYSRKEYEEAVSKNLVTDIERARRTIIRSFMGFGSNAIHHRSGFRGFCRESGNSHPADWANYVDAMDALIARLSGVLIENRPAVEVLLRQDGDTTLHYVDPPYVTASRGKCSGYKYEMTDDEHIALSTTLHELRGMVVLSGYRTPLYDELFSDWVSFEKIRSLMERDRAPKWSG